MTGLSAGRRRRELVVLFAIVILVTLAVTSGYSSPSRAAQATTGDTFWVGAYYPGWQQGYLPAAAIDFGAITP